MAARALGNAIKRAVVALKAPAAVGPYSQAIRAGTTVYCSGCLGLNPATKTLEADVEKQTKRAIENMQEILKAAEADLNNVVKTTVFLKNMSDFQKVNAVYAGFFEKPFPARSCVAVAELPLNALVEVECIAVKRSKCATSGCGTKAK
ncbi:MAG TPA: RidA family protein [Oculatellaceae cyanobacterium]